MFPLTLAFDALADFVKRTADPLATTKNILPTPDEESRRRADEVRRHEVDAQQRNDSPLARYLTALREAVSQKQSGVPVEPEVMKEVEELRRQLLQGDGFGEAPRKLPADAERAFTFLRRDVPAPEAAPTPERKTLDRADDLEVDDQVLAELNALAVDDPFLYELPEFESPEDAQVKDFVRRYFAEGFEDHAPADLHKSLEQQISQRQQVPLIGDETLQLVQAQLEPREARVFAQLKPEQRSQYLKMTPDEKVFVQQLKPDEREHYFTLNPDTRVLFRKLQPELRQQQVSQAKASQEAAAKLPPEELAKNIATNLMKSLDLSPVREPDLREKATAMAYNYLKSNGGDRAHAEMGTLRTLLSDPKVLHPLLADLGEGLVESTSPNAIAYREGMENEPTVAEKKPKGEVDEDGKPAPKLKKGRANYGQHFQRVRHTLPQLAQQLVQPGMTRKALLDGMKKAVIVSADYLVTYPRRMAVKSGVDPMRFRNRTFVG